MLVTLLSAISDFDFLGLVLRTRFLSAGGSNGSTSMSNKLSAGIPSNLGPASNEIISAV